MDCAIGLRQTDAVRLLLDHGVALSDDAIVRAMGSYRPELVTVVAAHVDDWNFTGKKTGITPLQSAIVAQHGPTVRLLLDAGAAM